MSNVDERKETYRDRIKQNKIESIRRIMRSSCITIEDLQNHVSVTNEEKLKQRRELQAYKAKAAASLVKAREAKKQKQESK